MKNGYKIHSKLKNFKPFLKSIKLKHTHNQIYFIYEYIGFIIESGVQFMNKAHWKTIFH